MRKIDHPLIVRLYETFEDEKNIFLVQEYKFSNVVSAKVDNCFLGSNSKEISANKTPDQFSTKWQNASNTFTHKRYAIET